MGAKRKLVPVRVIEGGQRPHLVREFATMFEYIFDDHNRKVGYSAEDLLSRFTEEVLDCLEYIAKDDMQGLERRIPRMFAWFLAFTNRLRIDVQTAAWHKYPGVCNRCFAHENCGCVVQKTKYDPHHPELPRYRRDKSRMPTSLDEWQQFHRKLYGRVNQLVGYFKVFCHLASEAREMSTDFRLKRVGDIEGEVADVFFWLVAFANSRGVSLAEATWARYPYECDTCRKQKCECEKQ